MAERRMFSKSLIDSDAFLDLPAMAQLLYFHLSMRADDDGFINNPKKIQRMICASDDDLKELIMKRFILSFDSGVVVIKHWRMHNYIQKDRYKPTVYKEEKAALKLQDNGSYTECIQDVSGLDTQDRLGKDSLGQDSTGEDSLGKEEKKKISLGEGRETRVDALPPTLKEVEDFCEERNSPVDPKRFYDFFTAGDWKDSKGQPVTAWKQRLITWENYESESRPTQTPRRAPDRQAGGEDDGTKLERMQKLYERLRKEDQDDGTEDGSEDGTHRELARTGTGGSAKLSAPQGADHGPAGAAVAL